VRGAFEFDAAFRVSPQFWVSYADHESAFRKSQMVDTTISPPAQWQPRANSQPVSLALSAVALVALLFALTWSWSAVATDIAEKRCDSPIGKLSVYLKKDQWFSNCQCMKHALDFSDPCNSMYIPLL
jgi:hypothetical protein